MAFGPSTAAATSNPIRADQIGQHESRIAGVAYSLAIANRQRCSVALVPQAGFAMLAAKHGVPAEPGSLIDVTAVVPSSPAAKAGLRHGDQVEAVNGRVLTSAAVGGTTAASVAVRANHVLLEEMAKGGIMLRIWSAGTQRVVRFTAETGCPSDVRLIPGTDVNAWADGERVMVTKAIVAQCATDDDLALVIAHELAHNILRHRERLAAAGMSTASPRPTSADQLKIVRETEEAADRLAVRMVSEAGYDLSGSAVFLGRLLEANGLSARAAATHPGARRRLALLRVAITQTTAAARVVL